MEPYFKGDYEIIPNGVDTERFKPDGERHEIYSKINGKTVLFLGRLEPRKGPDLLLKAFISRKKDFEKENVHLIFAGDGPLKESLMKMVPEGLKNRVHFLGLYRLKIFRRFTGGRMFIHPPQLGVKRLVWFWLRLWHPEFPLLQLTTKVI